MLIKLLIASINPKRQAWASFITSGKSSVFFDEVPGKYQPCKFILFILFLPP